MRRAMEIVCIQHTYFFIVWKLPISEEGLNCQEFVVVVPLLSDEVLRQLS